MRATTRAVNGDISPYIEVEGKKRASKGGNEGYSGKKTEVYNRA